MDYNERARRANEDLLVVVGLLKDDEGPWEAVRPARWRHTQTGVHVETGYSYGEGRVRVYADGSRVMTREHRLTGHPDQLAGVMELFPL